MSRSELAEQLKEKVTEYIASINDEIEIINICYVLCEEMKSSIKEKYKDEIFIERLCALIDTRIYNELVDSHIKDLMANASMIVSSKKTIKKWSEN